jgi:putative heme-binding domain-containing protein
MKLATEALRTPRTLRAAKPSVFSFSVFSASRWLILPAFLWLSAPAVAQTDVAAGSKLFNPVCSNGYCHGAGANGGGAPSLRLKKYSAEFLVRVISDGVSNTPMRGFKDDYTKDQIRQLAAYVQSLSGGSGKAADDGVPAMKPAADVPRNPTMDAGRDVFETHCAACHAVRGTGGKVGPDLSAVAGQTDLLKRITSPAEKSDSAYALISVTAKDGRVVTGVKRRETEDAIQVYDVSAMPPVSRSIAKEDVSKVEATGRSAMPADFGKRLTPKQLADLTAFLRASGASQ